MSRYPERSSRSTASIEPSGLWSMETVHHAVDRGCQPRRLRCAMQRREQLRRRFVGPLRGRQAEQDGALRVFVDGQRRQPGELPCPRLVSLAVGVAPLHEHDRRHHHRGDRGRCEHAGDEATPTRTGGPVAVHLHSARGEEATLVVAELEPGLGGPRLGQLEPAPAEEEARHPSPALIQSRAADSTRRRASRSSRASSTHPAKRFQSVSSASCASSTVGVRLAGSRSNVSSRWRPYSASTVSRSSAAIPACSSSVRRTRRRVSP